MFYEVRYTTGIFSAADEIMARKAEKIGRHYIATGLGKAYVDDINGSVKTMEQAQMLKNDLPLHTGKHSFHMEGMVIKGEQPQDIH